MAAYLVIAVCLWSLAYLEQTPSQHRRSLLHWPALILFIGFAGLRFETGYDWLGYERVLSDTPTLREVMECPDRLTEDTQMEPLFAALNVAVKSVGGDLQLLFFVAMLFNGLVIYRFVCRYGRFPLFCLATYFCWAYLTAQMTLVRQSLASSFILLAVLYVLENKKFKAAVFVLLGIGFHVSVAMFVPVFFLTRFRPRPSWLAAAVLMGFFVLFNGGELFQDVLEFIRPYTANITREKIDVYINVGAYEVTTGSLIYAAINTLFLGLAYREGERTQWTLRSRLFFHLSLFLLVGQLYFSALPVIWNRIQCVVFVVQTCQLASRLAIFRFRLQPLLACAACSMVVLLWYLAQPRNTPFIPYRSYLEYAVTGDPGDGRARMERAIVEYDASNLAIEFDNTRAMR
jgi:hypothetical protein